MHLPERLIPRSASWRPLLFVCALLTCLLSSCGTTDTAGPAAQGTPRLGDAGTSVQAIIGPGGGAIRTSDGAVLTIPAGALAANTLIRVSTPSGQSPSGTVLTYILEPEGTTFASAVTLTVPVADDGGSDPQILLLAASPLNPELDAGSELTNLQPLPIIAQDTTNNTVTVALRHFTVIYALRLVNDNGYLVIDIPEKYLRPGDLLFTLTQVQGDGPNWAPGHVGVFTRGIAAPAGNFIGQLIEATPPKVARNTLSSFRTESNHLYLGPRRPAGLTADEGSLMALDAEALLGTPYTKLGSSFSLDGSFQGQLSCVGLAERLLDSVGRGVLNGFQEATIPTPYELYAATRPVTQISVCPGDRIDIPIYGVVVHPNSPYLGTVLRGFYSRQREFGSETNIAVPPPRFPYYTIMASNQPSGSQFFETKNSKGKFDGYRFVWTPGVEHAGKAFGIPLRLTGTPLGVVANFQPTFFGLFEQPIVDLTGGRLALDPVDMRETLVISVCPLEDGTGVEADQTSLSFEHCVGETTCPQLVGSVTITNRTNQTRRFTASPHPDDAASSSLVAVTQGTSPSPTSGEIPPNGSVTFDVFFDCSQTESFNGGVVFKGVDSAVPPAPDVQLTVNVQGTLKHKAVVLDNPLGPFPAGTEIRLSRITGGIEAGPDACQFDHLHGSPTITVDGTHTDTDPNPGGCGFGRIMCTEGGR